jgi:hypothetical protein
VNAPSDTITPPLRVEPAYPDRASVWNTVVAHSPYQLMAGSDGYAELIGDQPLYPFFRSAWAAKGVAIDDEADRILNHVAFVDAARRLFDAAVARPTDLIVNVMARPVQGDGTWTSPRSEGWTGQGPPPGCSSSWAGPGCSSAGPFRSPGH